MPLLLLLFLVLAVPAQANDFGSDFGYILPEINTVNSPESSRTFRFRLGALDVCTEKGLALVRPQTFTVFHQHDGEMERTEHLSVLEETETYGARSWQAEIFFPESGVYQLVMQSKPVWQPEQDSFSQYMVKLLFPALDSSSGWDCVPDTSFTIVPCSRPFGLLAGMLLSGQVLRDGKPLSNALVEVARLDPELPMSITAAAPARSKRKLPERILPTRLQAVQQVKADSRGIFAFACPQPGWWVFSSSMDGDPLKDYEGKLKPVRCRTELWAYFAPIPTVKPAGGKK